MKKLTAKDIWLNYIRQHWPIYAFGLFTMFLTDFMLVISTRSIGWVIDFFLHQKKPSWIKETDIKTVFYILLLVVIVPRILLIFGRMGWRLTLARQSHYAGGMLKEKIWEKASFFPRSTLDDKYAKGVVMNISTSDVGMARFIFGFTFVGAIDVLFLAVTTLIALFSIDLKITLASLAVLVFIPWLATKLSNVEGKRYYEAQDKLSAFNDLSSQVVSSIRLHRLTQTGSFWEKKLKESAKDYRATHLIALVTSLRYLPLMGGASILTYMILFTIGIMAVFKSLISIGDFVAIQSLIFVLQQPLMGLGFIISDFRKSWTSLERLTDFYNEPIDESLVKKGEGVKENESILEVKNLTFSYPAGKKILFSNFNLEIKRSQRIGITGPIGSGKTTLVNILSGIERNYKGDVFLCSKPFSSYGHEELRNAIAFVPQRPFLFADTIRKNLSLDQNFSDEELWSFLEMAGMKKDVLSFSDKLDTPLGEWGINLSGGQKQRMTLARALARKPKLLFLDDVLSAVDTVTEEEILRSLDKEMKETTIIWIAHRKSTLKYCDRIIEL